MTPQEMIAVIAGFAAGKKVQFRNRHSLEPWFTATSEPSWDFYRQEFRLVPEAVPPGDLTQEEAEKLRLAGVPIQFFSTSDGEWMDRPVHWGGCTDGDAYRKSMPPSPAPKPAPRMVPLGSEDVRPGDAVRSKPGHFFLVGSNYDKHGISISFVVRDVIEWDELQQKWEISHDGGKTWARAEKPEPTP